MKIHLLDFSRVVTVSGLTMFNAKANEAVLGIQCAPVGVPTMVYISIDDRNREWGFASVVKFRINFGHSKSKKY